MTHRPPLCLQASKWWLGPCFGHATYGVDAWCESCGFAGKVCIEDTDCQDATPEDTAANAHPRACY